jgi:hypothetical protein
MASTDEPGKNAERATNPYAPPVSVVTSSPESNDLGRTPDLRMPGSEFWMVAIGAIGLSIIATFLTQGATFPIAIALIAGAVRVCLVYWRRGVRGLTVLPSLPLLFTSTCVTFGLGLSCTIAFCGICTGGVFAVDSLHPGRGSYDALIAWMIACAGLAIIGFVFLFAWSIKWAS